MNPRVVLIAAYLSALRRLEIGTLAERLLDSSSSLKRATLSSVFDLLLSRLVMFRPC